MLMATKLGRMMVYLEGLLHIKPLDTLITWMGLYPESHMVL